MKVLVILCTHQGAEFLNKQLDSIFTQKIPNDLELAVCAHDWGSTDDTTKILMEYKELHSNMDVILHKEAPGPCVSFLKALTHCVHNFEFDFVTFCDQDDVWADIKLAEFKNQQALRANATIYFSDVSVVDQNCVPLNVEHYEKLFKKPFVVDASIFVSNPIIGMTMFFPKELALSFVGKAFSLDCLIMHDWSLAIYGYLKDYEFVFIPKKLVFYRQHTSNILGVSSNKVSFKQVSKAMLLISHIKSQCLELHAETSTRKLIGITAKSTFLRTKAKIAFVFLFLTNLIFYKGL